MARICPQCQQLNTESTIYCRTCGYRFQGNEQEVDDGATIRPGNLAALPANADPSETLKPGLPPVSQPVPVVNAPIPQTPPAYGQAPQQIQAQQPTPFYGQSAPLAQQQMYAPQQPLPPAQAPAYGQYHPQGGYNGPVPVAMTPPFRASLQRAFAGKGTPVHHRSWLLENKQVQPQALHSAFIANLQKQNVMGVLAETERLSEIGSVVEERDYVKVRYGASTVFVYLAPMGQNLYVSRTSTIQQPYSRLRVTVLAGLAVLMVLSLIFFSIINPTYDPANPGIYGFVSEINQFFHYAFLGLLFFFVIAAIRSLVFWLSDKDFLAILRPNRLNDFSLDALSSIEQTTDKALRVTLQDAGLDAEVITLTQNMVPQQALYRI